MLYAAADKVAMAVTGLPLLEGDSVYQCWWINSKTGEVTPGSTFKVDANGAGVWAWSRPRQDVNTTRWQFRAKAGQAIPSPQGRC